MARTIFNIIYDLYEKLTHIFLFFYKGMNIIESFELETLHTKLKKNYNISLLLEHTMYIFISFSIFFLLFFKVSITANVLTRLFCLFV